MFGKDWYASFKCWHNGIRHKGDAINKHPLIVIVFVVAAGVGIVSGVATWHWHYQKTAFGPCELKPITPANRDRIDEYIQEGQAYARNSKYKDAAAEFQLAIDTDPHYLGANQNLGIVRMEEGDFPGAIQSFGQEINLIDCLRKVSPKELWRFAYMVHESTTENGDKTKAFKERLDEAEDTVHYNLACALTKEREPQNALGQLEKAARYGRGSSIHGSVLDNDRDLDPLRNDSGYQKTRKQFHER